MSEYDNVSILLGANSFIPEIQDKMVGCGKDGGVIHYTKKRDKALQLLVKYGFNNPAKGKRLALELEHNTLETLKKRLSD